MKRLNVMLSDEAKQIIIDYQDDNNISTLDESTNKYILNTRELLIDEKAN